MNHIIDEYLHIPFVTRTYLTLCTLTTLAVQIDLITPFQLYFNPSLIIQQYQIWRLLTSFCFFGSLGINFFFNMLFTYRHCRSLEENSFQGRTADFLFMFIFGGILMVIVALFVNMIFLGHALTTMLVYIWSRRNPFVRMNFFGLFNFSAPYLPWVLLAFSVLLGNSALVDIVGISVGHIYYFLEDVFPRQRNGFRLLKTPYFLKYLIDGPPHSDIYVPLPEENGDPNNIPDNNNIQ